MDMGKILNANAYYARPYSVNVSADGTIYTVGQDLIIVVVGSVDFNQMDKCLRG